MIASINPAYVDLYIVLGVMALAVAAGFGLFFAWRSNDRRGVRDLQRITQELAQVGAAFSDEPVVNLRFHTYRGLIVHTRQAEHRISAPISAALDALDQLHRHNLRWNWLGPHALVIPLLSWSNRAVQRRSIRRQAREKGWTGV